MLRKILPLFFVCCVLAAIEVTAQSAFYTARELAGNYSFSDSWNSRVTTLKADLTYSSLLTTDVCEIESPGSSECLNYPHISGIFWIDGNVLNFAPQSYRRYENGILINTLPPPSEYLVVKWTDRFYLIEKERLKEFADAVNMKLEPRKSEYAVRGNYFLLRDEGSKKPVEGLPDLPDGWNDYLLKKPLTATVLSVKMKNGETIAVIDKGSRDGLKVGIQIVNGFPDNSEVVSVKKTTSEVKIKSKVKKGDHVYTFFDLQNLFLNLSPRR